MTTSSLGTGRSVIMMPSWLISGSAFREWLSPLLAGVLIFMVCVCLHQESEKVIKRGHEMGLFALGKLSLLTSGGILHFTCQSWPSWA